MSRRYSDTEARRILRRATDEEPGTALSTSTEGHSLRELEEAAGEAGIDPVSVRVAALSSLPPASTSMGGRLIGGSARRRHSLFVPGRLPADRHREVTGALEAVLDREMTMEYGGGYVVWEEDHRQGWTRVTAREVEGGLEVGVEADRRGWVTLAGVGSAAVVGALAPALWSGMVGGLGAPVLLFAVLAVALVVGGIRLVWAPAAKRLHARLERAAAEVVARIEPPESDSNGGSAGGAP